MFRWLSRKVACGFVWLGLFYGLLDWWGTLAGYEQISWLVTPALDVLVLMSKVLVAVGVGLVCEYAFEGYQKGAVQK